MSPSPWPVERSFPGLRWADESDPVYLDMEFDDETWGISPPMPRWVAEAACFDFGQGVPWNGRRVTKALIVPWAPIQ